MNRSYWEPSSLPLCGEMACVVKDKGSTEERAETGVGEEEGRTRSKRGRDPADDPAWIPDFRHSNSG